MNEQYIKDRIAEIETACSMARLALFTSQPSEKVWSEAAKIIGNAHAIQAITGETKLIQKKA